jgi:hypothetical protein
MLLLLTLKRQDFLQKNFFGKLLFMVKETTILDHDLRSKPTDPDLRICCSSTGSK